MNKFIYNIETDIKPGSIIKFKNEVFARFADNRHIRYFLNNKVFLRPEKVPLMRNGMKIVFPSIMARTQEVTEYTMEDVDYTLGCFKICLNGVQQSFSMDFTDIYIRLKDERLKVVNTDLGKGLTFEYNDVPLEFVDSYFSADYIVADILKEKVVCSHWWTPIFNFGGSEMSKTLLKMSITTEPAEDGKITFGYRTADSGYSIEKKGENFFSFDNLDFTNFTFKTSFANSYTVDLKENFNYIQFYFKSDKPTDCVVHNITVIYKENRFNKGVE